MKIPKVLLGLLLLTAGALLVHGYHPFAEDAEIYLPGVEKILQPELFAGDARFFEPYTRLSGFAYLIAASVRVSHLPLEVVLFLWHVGSIFLLLLGCWQLSGKCFVFTPARWAGVAMVAALLTMPVTGTALYFMDQYVNPRNFAAVAAIFAVSGVLRKMFVVAGLWLGFAVMIHPLMGAFAVFYCGVLLALERLESHPLALGSMLPAFLPGISSRAYHEAARLHAYHYLFNWRWYEWLGIFAPIAILWWFLRIAKKEQFGDLQRMCRASIVYGVICFTAALSLGLLRDERMARFQPLRGLHLLYVLLFLFAGGFFGQYILKKKTVRWAALFVPLCLGMFLAQRALFPQSAHIEWPGASARNPWAQAFLWVRQNTAVRAKFAVNPNYVEIRGEDANGFRAIALRSKLADTGADSGAVSMFPSLADPWWKEVQAQGNWQHLRLPDFQRLRSTYGVNWVILQAPGVEGLTCPYQNETVMVCTLDGTSAP